MITTTPARSGERTRQALADPPLQAALVRLTDTLMHGGDERPQVSDGNDGTQRRIGVQPVRADLHQHRDIDVGCQIGDEGESAPIG